MNNQQQLSEKTRALLIRNPPLYFTYVGSVDDEFECPVCRVPFCAPQVHEPCGNSFCQNCAEQLSTCPFCRMNCKDQLKPSNTRLVLNVLDKLVVKCNDCNLTIPRAQFEDHYNSRCLITCAIGCGEFNRKEILLHQQSVCPGTILHCNNVPCKTTYPRSESNKHAQTCLYQLITCPNNCGSKPLFRKDVKKHIASCDLVSVQCPRNCGKSILRKNQIEHDAECEELNATCRAVELGCEVKLKRKLIHQHEASCPLVKMSIKLAEVISKLDSVEENFKSQVAHLKENITAKDKEIKELKSKVKVQKKTFSEQLNRLNNQVATVDKLSNHDLENAIIRCEQIKRQQCQEMKNFQAYVTIKEKEFIMGAYNANLYTVLENMGA